MVVALLLAFATSAAISQESFNATHFATIDATQETEQIDDIIANGIAIFKVLPGTNVVQYRVTVTGIVDTITMAHIHRGPPGENGPVVVPLAIDDNNLTVTGTATDLSASFMDSLLSGMAYVNIHTKKYGSGHIRGQIVPIPNAVAAQMTTAAEPDPVESDSGTGSTVMYINPATGVANYTVEWNMLTGPPTMAHFHMAPVGQVSGPPVHTITIPGDPAIERSSGTWQMTAEHIAAMLEGRIYANVHTSTNPGGEIRGTVLVADFYSAFVDAANEVPSRADSSDAMGTATMLVLRAPGLGLAAVSSVVNNTTGPIMMAHVHRGAIGVNGGTFVNLAAGKTPQNWDSFLTPVVDSNMRRLWAGEAYVNYHTERFGAGEARGQLMPGLLNLAATPASVPMASESMREMTAWHDRSGGSITFRVPSDVNIDARGARVELYAADGVRVARAEASSNTVVVATGDIASGAYFARLVVDGRVEAVARVAVR